MSAFVTIDSFLDVPLAELAKAKLESEGIYCHLLGKHHIGVNWLYANAIGGVKLQVRKEDETAARNILDKDESFLLEDGLFDLPEAGSDERCEACGSTSLEFVDRRRLSGMLMLLSIPLLFWGKYSRCRECGHKRKM